MLTVRASMHASETLGGGGGGGVTRGHHDSLNYLACVRPFVHIKHLGGGGGTRGHHDSLNYLGCARPCVHLKHWGGGGYSWTPYLIKLFDIDLRSWFQPGVSTVS